jgi:selenocysteine lyase/cysteine desulfurase
VLGDDEIRDLRARELPVMARHAYLDHATVGPLPLRHARAVSEVAERTATEGRQEGEVSRLLDEVRSEAARLLYTEPDRITLQRSTSEGLSVLARGLEWRDGDEVLVYERDFVGCLAPFLALQREGVQARWIPDRGHRFDLDDVAALLGPRTRAVCVSLVNRSHGMRAPVAELGALCRERGVWLALDAAQAMGVLDLDAAGIGADILSAHGYKFLCAGFGLAVTYCSERATAELRPPLVGWKNAALDESLALSLGPAGEASRFEPSLSSLAGLAGMRASLELLGELDAGERERRAVGLAAEAGDGLAARGYDVVDQRAEERSSLVAARHQRLDADNVERALRSAGVVCATVDGLLRVSTHVFNTSEDVERLLEALPSAP